MIPIKEVERVCRCTGYSYEELNTDRKNGYMPVARWLVMQYFWKTGYSQEVASSIFNHNHCIIVHLTKELANIEERKDPIGKYELIRRFRNKIMCQYNPVDNGFYPFAYNANLQQQ